MRRAILALAPVALSAWLLVAILGVFLSAPTHVKAQCGMMLCGVGGGPSGGTNFLLANTGSALLVNTGSKFLIK